MAAFLDNCKFTPTAGGTTDWTYSAAVTGYQSPAAAGVVNGTKYKYFAASADLTQWEIGEGAYNTSTGVLPRTSVLYNSSGTGTASGQSGAGSKISFIAAPAVAIVAVKEDLISVEETNSFTSTQQLQARTNLGMSSVIGTIEWWPCSDLPAGRLRADGTGYSRTTYADLFNYLVKTGAATFTNGSTSVGMTSHGRSVNDPVKLFTTGSLPTNFTAGTHGLVTSGTVYYVKTVIDANTVTFAATPGGAAVSAGSAGSGTQTWICAPHGDGDGSTTFTVPDYRGDFLRSLDNGAGIDANRSVGSVQLDAFQGHEHGLTSVLGYGSGPYAPNSGSTWTVYNGTSAPVTDGINGSPRTAAETRPRNAAALVTIRYAA